MISKSKLDQIKKVQNEISRILNNLGDGEITSSAYDTAWVARIPNKDNTSEPMFPECLEWIKNNQLIDGSWGTDNLEYYHDRILCTLSSIITLKFWDSNEDQIKGGENYINKNLKNLKKDDYATVGFELIFPTLIFIAKDLELNIDFENESIKSIDLLRQEKLKRLSLDTIYEYKSTIGHSLECLEDRYMELDFTRLKIHQSENGSYGCSPASTAFVLIHNEDKKAEEYLYSLVKRFKGSVPFAHPIDVFERVWILNTIIDTEQTNIFLDSMKKQIDYLNTYFTPKGIGFSKFFGVNDLDDTAATLRLLNRFNIKKDLEVFKYYESEEGFLCYKGELKASFSYISHMITALIENDKSKERDRLLEKAVDYLLKNINRNFTDKWHTSPYYTISRISFNKVDEYKDINKKIIKFIQDTQQNDGGWGYYGSTSEETAYALLAIMKLGTYSNKQIENGFNYLSNHLEVQNENLWIGKVIYSPMNINKAVRLIVLLKLLTLIYG